MTNGVASAEQYQIIGKLNIDSFTKTPGSTLTAVFSIENCTDSYWSVDYTFGYSFRYEIIEATDNGNYVWGKLPYSGEVIGTNRTTVIGMGTIPLVDKYKRPLRPGTSYGVHKA